MLFAPAVRAAPASQPASRPAPIVLAEGKDYIVHWLKDDGVILHTQLSTRVPRILLIVRGWGTFRMEILAARADGQRLYVLTRETIQTVPPVYCATSDGLPPAGHTISLTGSPPAQPLTSGLSCVVTPNNQPPESISTDLAVYWLEDGSTVYFESVTKRILRGLSRQLSGPMPDTLELSPGGVSCGLEKYRFEGRKLVSPATMPE